MIEMHRVMELDSLSSNLEIIKNWLRENAFSFDDTRRIISLFSSHASYARDCARMIRIGKETPHDLVHHYVARICGIHGI